MPLKVLVIDPNAAASTLVSRTLSREGYEVATAATLDEGLAVFEGSPADLLLLSAEVGTEALEGWWQRAGAVVGQVPIVLIGEGGGDVVPAADTLATPIDADNLIHKVQDQVGRAEPAGGLAWLPESLKEASDEIAEMERLLGWSAPAEAGGAGEADPVSLGIFSEREAQAPASGGPEADAPTPDAETVAEGLDRIREPEADAAPAEPEVAAVQPAAAGPEPEPAAEPTPAAPQRRSTEPVVGVPPERVEQIVAELAREAVERVVWETVPAMVARVISQNRAEQDKLFTQIVERVVWETIPEIAENRVQAEIRRISEGDGG